MLFPKGRMEVTRSYQGRTSQSGWLVLTLGGLDLEGVNKVYLDFEDIEYVKSRGSGKEDILAKIKSQLGGDL